MRVTYVEPRYSRSSGFLHLWNDVDSLVRDDRGRAMIFDSLLAVAGYVASVVGEKWHDIPCEFWDIWGDDGGNKIIDWDDVFHGEDDE